MSQRGNVGSGSTLLREIEAHLVVQRGPQRPIEFALSRLPVVHAEAVRRGAAAGDRLPTIMAVAKAVHTIAPTRVPVTKSAGRLPATSVAAKPARTGAKRGEK